MNMSDDMRRMLEAVKGAIEHAAKVFARFGETAMQIAEREYLSHHKRLPGSSRTSRLRKKRRSRVLHWFAKRCEQAATREALSA